MAYRPDNEPDEFRFLDPEDLTDGELRLVLQERFPGDPSRNCVPEYRFRMVHVGTGAEVGAIKLRVGNTEHVLKFAGHISYAVHPEHRGHRYAVKATAILLPLAKRHGLGHVAAKWQDVVPPVLRVGRGHLDRSPTTGLVLAIQIPPQRSCG